MKKLKLFVIGILSLLIIYLALVITVDFLPTGNGSVEDFNNFTNSEAWPLALAVKHENTWAIKLILNLKPDLVNFREEDHGATLLLWAVGMDKYKSVETLLKCGADPNIPIRATNETPLFIASGFLWNDTEANEDPKYVKLLLEYDADPNVVYFEEKRFDGTNSIIENDTSALMYSLSCGFDKTKLLIENGADINHKTKFGDTAATLALKYSSFGASKELLNYPLYIIVEKKAKVNEAYFVSNDSSNKERKPVSLLRNWIYPLNSEEYIIKMKIVEEFKRQGIDYFKEEIPVSILEEIKKEYPNNWQEYIKKY